MYLCHLCSWQGLFPPSCWLLLSRLMPPCSWSHQKCLCACVVSQDRKTDTAERQPSMDHFCVFWMDHFPQLKKKSLLHKCCFWHVASQHNGGNDQPQLCIGMAVILEALPVYRCLNMQPRLFNKWWGFMTQGVHAFFHLINQTWLKNSIYCWYRTYK